jgi:glycosyltransferase involved in cell wall biosynthesis
VKDGVNGYLVPKRDPTALAARILFLLQDRRRREQLSSHAKADAQAYDWAKIVERMMGVYEEALAHRAAEETRGTPGSEWLLVNG